MTCVIEFVFWFCHTIILEIWNEILFEPEILCFYIYIYIYKVEFGI